MNTVATRTVDQNPPDFSQQHGGASVPSVRPMAGVERVFGAQQVQVYRDEAKILQKLKTLAAAAGGEWYYRFPVKNRATNSVDWIEGPSIKLANDMCRIYGNCDIDTRVIDLGDSWLFYARFIDLETGYSLTRPFQQRKAQVSINTKDPARAQDIAFQIGCSKAIRNVAVNALQTFADFAFDEARGALVAKVGTDLDGWRKRTVEGIAKIPVDIKRVEHVIGRVAKDWLAPDVARVIAMMKAIADGMATADETFPDPNAKPADDQQQTRQPPGTVEETLDQFGRGGGGAGVEGGESPPGADSGTQTQAGTQETSADRTTADAPGGGATGVGGSAPNDPASYDRYARLIIDGAVDRASAAKVEAWWGSDEERKLRNACHVDMTLFNTLKELVAAKVAAFAKGNAKK